MKKKKIIISSLLFFQFVFSFAQTWSKQKQGAYRIHLDFEYGLHYLALKKIAANFADSTRNFYHLGTTASVTLVQPLIYLNRNISICAFLKPGLASPWSKVNLRQHHHYQNSWGLWQFPFGAAIKILDRNNSSKNIYKWEGLMLAAGVTFNYYDLTSDRLPDLIPVKPQIIFFATWHADQLGFRITATQRQNYFYSNGNSTSSNWEFSASILLTTRW